MRVRIALGVGVFTLAIACTGLLGLGDYHEVSTPSATDAGGGCDVDLTKTCYACAPTNNEQFLNSCGSGDCVPFDDKRVTKALADGGLPPAPPGGDGGI
jgi:hypothetical protein